MLDSEHSALYRRRLCDSPSPYQHLLDLPPSEEAFDARLQIKDYIGRLRAKLYEVEDRVEQLRLALQRAELDRQSIRSRIDAHIALNPPIHDIHPRYLRGILSHMHHAVKTIGEQQGYMSLGIHLLFGPHYLYRFKFNARKLEWKKWVVTEALARSGQTLLALDINFFALTEVDERRSLISDVGTLYGGRVKELRVSFPKWKELRVFPCLDNLEEFHLTYRPHIGVGIEDTPPFDVTMPRLFHFSLESKDLTPFLPDSAMRALPWLQLTSLHIRNESAAVHRTRAHLYRVISQCPNLVTLKVWAMTYDGTEGRHTDERTLQVTLPRLRNLHIICPVILTKLTCPVLHRLALDIHSYSNLISDCVEGFISRSGCLVQEVQISLYHPSCTPSYLSAVLKPLSTVRHLEVDFTHATPPFDTYFRALFDVADDDDDMLFPLLQSLTVKSSPLNLQFATDAHGGSMSESVILDALRKRRRAAHSQLRSLRLELHLAPMKKANMYRFVNNRLGAEFAATDLYKGLKELEDGGLELEVCVIAA
ncbi:hypothetical protein BDZ89DRAFT_1068015 [Hymenopellis radicata]|nr:hypothetical protein BDZ89DRAFT_1068015 [Hymenopellis radicata]